MNVKLFQQSTVEFLPLIIAIGPTLASTHCTFCLRPTSNAAAPYDHRCQKCKFVHYCSKHCLKADWSEHKKECTLLKDKFQLWSTIHSVDIAEMALVILRMELKRFGNATGDIVHITNANKPRFYEPRWQRDLQEALLDLGCEIDDYRFADLYEKAMHGINIGCGIVVTNLLHLPRIGTRVYESSLSAFANSCRPNAHVVYCQCCPAFRIVPFLSNNGRPMVDNADNLITSFRVARLGVRLDSTKGVRRFAIRHLYSVKKCDCDRCEDPRDDLLSAICCRSKRCSATIPIDDTEFRFVRDARLRTLSAWTIERLNEIMTELAIWATERQPHSWMHLGALPSVVCPKCEAAQPSEWIEYSFALQSLAYVLIENPFYQLTAIGHPEHGAYALELLDREVARVLPDCNLARVALHHFVDNWIFDQQKSPKKIDADRLAKCIGVYRWCFPFGHPRRIEITRRTCWSMVENAQYDDAKLLIDELELSAQVYAFACNGGEEITIEAKIEIENLRRCLIDESHQQSFEWHRFKLTELCGNDSLVDFD